MKSLKLLIGSLLILLIFENCNHKSINKDSNNMKKDSIVRNDIDSSFLIGDWWLADSTNFENRALSTYLYCYLPSEEKNYFNEYIPDAFEHIMNDKSMQGVRTSRLLIDFSGLFATQTYLEDQRGIDQGWSWFGIWEYEKGYLILKKSITFTPVAKFKITLLTKTNLVISTKLVNGKELILSFVKECYLSKKIKNLRQEKERREKEYEEKKENSTSMAY